LWHLLKGSGIDLPPVITDNQVTTGVGTEPVLVTPTKAKAMIQEKPPAIFTKSPACAVLTALFANARAIVAKLVSDTNTLTWMSGLLIRLTLL
jgi:hypothetical protein